MRLKNRDEIIYNAFQVCLIHLCKNEATHLFSTESNVIDVCEYHYKALEAEKYKS